MRAMRNTQSLAAWFDSSKHGPPSQLIKALACLLAVVGLLACAPENAGVLAGKRALTVRSVERAARINDGVAAAAGDEWDSHLTALLRGPDAQIVYDLGAPTPLRSAWIQADNDDTYELAVSDDNTTFRTLWEAKATRGSGLRPRVGHFDDTARYVRLRAKDGDGNYSVSELQLSSTNVDGPLGLRRASGQSLDEQARTSALHLGFGLLAVAFLVRKTRRFPTWPLGLLALGFAVFMIARVLPDAWPIDNRGVSLVRAMVALVATVVLGWETFAPPRFAPDRRVSLGVLGVCGVLGLLAFYNLGHPQFWDGKTRSPSYVHYLDLRQYHQTSKYFPEIGYRRLYEADAAAYLEDTGEPFEKIAKLDMRNLDTNLIEKMPARREVIEAMPKRFSKERWEAYKRDARFFRETIGKEYWFETMHDLGGNATPVWIANAYLLFNSFEASDASFLRVASLDFLLILAMFVAIFRTFGARAAFVSMVLFGCNDFIMYGTNWGGAIFRHDWLVCLGFGICALATKRSRLAGVLLAMAAAFRAFPGLALIGVFFPAAWVLLEQTIERRALPSFEDAKKAAAPALQVTLAAIVALVVLFGYSVLVLSPAAWTDWVAKIRILNADAHVNSVSLQALLAGETIRNHVIAQRRPEIWTAIVVFVVAILATARKRPLFQAAVAGIFLLPIVMNPSNYYMHLVCFYPLLVIAPVVWRSKDERVNQLDESAPDAPRTPFDQPLPALSALVAMLLMGMCATHYFPVLVSDRGVHFYLLSATLIVGLSFVLFVVLHDELPELVELMDRAFAPDPDGALVQATTGPGEDDLADDEVEKPVAAAKPKKKKVRKADKTKKAAPVEEEPVEGAGEAEKDEPLDEDEPA
jgi:hypothetical protein